MLNRLTKKSLIDIIINMEKYTNNYIYFKDSQINKQKKTEKITIPIDKQYYWVK
jgi:hypothetical protein